METKMLSGEREVDLKEAAKLLQDGEIVAFPTETVYGLGANAMDAAAVKKIYEAKGRPSDNPLIVHIYDRKQLKEFTEGISEDACVLMDTFWPGPLTLIFKRKGDLIAPNVTGGLDTIAVRMPNHPVALELLKRADLPIAAPSANTSGKPSPTAASHVEHDLNGKISAIVSGGSCVVGLESTVLDLSGDMPVILRPGGVTKEDLEQVLKREVRYATPHTSEEETPRAPGMKYKHYAPEAPVYICEGTPEEVAAKIDEHLPQHQGRAAILVSSQTKALIRNEDENLILDLGSLDDLTEIACHLFGALRYCDESDVEVIYTENYPSDEIGAALMNRLQKAAGEKRL